MIDDVRLPHLGDKRKAALKAFGILDLAHLISWNPRDLLLALIRYDPTNQGRFGNDLPLIIGLAKATRWDRPVLWHVLGETALLNCADRKDDIYFDLEYESAKPPLIFAWAAGIAIDDKTRDGDFQIMDSDFARDRSDAKRVFLHFKDFVYRHPNNRFVGYSLKSAEFPILNQLDPALKDHLAAHYFDPYVVLYNHLALPAAELGLRNVGAWVTGETPLELNAWEEYERYCNTLDISEKKAIMDRILKYNASDVRLTWAVARAIARILKGLKEE